MTLDDRTRRLRARKTLEPVFVKTGIRKSRTESRPKTFKRSVDPCLDPAELWRYEKRTDSREQI